MQETADRDDVFRLDWRQFQIGLKANRFLKPALPGRTETQTTLKQVLALVED